MKARTLASAISLLFATVPFCLPGVAAQPEPDAGWNSFFGNLHAHTAVSDGVERPAKAFEWARKEAKLDFLCLSEHNHLSQQTGLDEAHKAALAATSDSFVGLVGQEFSVISRGNHVNVYDVSLQIPAAMNSNYRGLFGQWLRDYNTANPTRPVPLFGRVRNEVPVLLDLLRYRAVFEVVNLAVLAANESFVGGLVGLGRDASVRFNPNRSRPCIVHMLSSSLDLPHMNKECFIDSGQVLARNAPRLAILQLVALFDAEGQFAIARTQTSRALAPSGPWQ